MNALRISETEVGLVRVLFSNDGEEMQRIVLDRLLHVEGREDSLNSGYKSKICDEKNRKSFL